MTGNINCIGDGELLFLDTFSHENTTELNLDLVQFPKPVLLSEVRILPLGTRVHIDVPGGMRMGATNPSSFKLELFVNNLNKPAASTFEKLGVLEYKENNEIQRLFEQQIPTDGLIIKGWYTTITLAVYGKETGIDNREQSSPPPPPPPPQVKAKQSVSLENISSFEQSIMSNVEKRENLLPPLGNEWQSVKVDSTQLQTSSDLDRRGGKDLRGQHADSITHRSSSTDIGRNSYNTSQQDADRHYTRTITKEADVKSELRDPEPGEIYDEKDAFSTHRTSHFVSERDSERDYRNRCDDASYESIDRKLNQKDNRDTKTRSNRQPDKDRNTSRSPENRSRSLERRQDDFMSGKLKGSPVKGPVSPPRSRGSPSQTPERSLFDDEAEPGEIAEDNMEGLYDNLKSGDSVDIYELLSDGEIQEGDGGAYSEISSDEGILTQFDEDDLANNVVSGEFGMDMTWLVPTSFNPFQCDLALLETFNDPALTSYEVLLKQLLRNKAALLDLAEPAALLKRATEIFATIRDSRWLDALDQILPILYQGLAYFQITCDGVADVLEVLISWAIDGVTMSKALAQPEAVYKVKHIKLGVLLVEKLLSCNAMIARLLLKLNIQQKLIDLFQSEYMASSIKQSVVRAIDASLLFAEGYDSILGLCPAADGKAVEAGDETKATPYRQLMNIISSKQLVRCVVAISTVLRKCHLYELLVQLENCVDSLAVDSAPVDGGKGSSEDLPSIGNEKIIELDEDKASLLVENLEEITQIYRSASDLLSLPAKSLPIRFLSVNKDASPDVVRYVYSIFTSRRLLECLFVLLASPSSCVHPGVFSAVSDLLQSLVSRHTGRLFLCSKPDVVNGIIRTLIQNAEIMMDEAHEELPTHHLGLQLVSHLQVLQYVDQLRVYHAKDAREKSLDDAEAVAVLHSLYAMTTLSQGREGIVNVLVNIDHIPVLLAFIQVTGDESVERVRRSVTFSYAILLLLLVAQHSEQVDWLLTYGRQILTLTEHSDQAKLAEKVNELHEWMTPLGKLPSLSWEDNIEALMTQLKDYSKEIDEIPKGLVTTLRILQHLAVPQSDNFLASDLTENIQFREVQIQIYSLEGISFLAAVLQKVGDQLMRPWQQGCLVWSGRNGTFMMSVIKPAIALLKTLLSHVIEAQGAQFKDLNCVGALLKLHTVLSTITRPDAASEIVQVQKELIAVLMTHTQPIVYGEDNEDALTNSLWTRMMKEVIEWTVGGPASYLTGLELISELLPLTLPVQTKEPLTSEQTMLALNSRKLWSAHLHPLSQLLTQLITDFALSSCQSLQHMLKRVCAQIADLSVATATTVTRAVLDVLLENFALRQQVTQDQTIIEEPIESYSCHILGLLAHLLTQPVVKAVFLQFTRPNGKGEEKYAEVMNQLIHLLNIVSEKPFHRQAQDFIATSLHSLCDSEITLITGDHNLSPLEELANALPHCDDLMAICTGLLHHLDNGDQPFSSILVVLRTLMVLLEHDVGFYYIKMALDCVPTAFYRLFHQINAKFSSDSSDCLATLTIAMDCVHFLITVEQVDNTISAEDILRTMRLAGADIRRFLCWNSENCDQHPLSEMEKLLKESAKDEDGGFQVEYDSINTLIKTLKMQDSSEDAKFSEIKEPEMPQPESVPNQFAKRAIYELMVDDESERVVESFWPVLPSGDEAEQEIEQLSRLSCNLEELSQKYCTDFNLLVELEKGTSLSEVTAGTRMKRKRNRNIDTINTSKMRGPGKHFVAPMRGRGFGNSMMAGRNDPFRSRAPNTSRPPSMHVDDFEKMKTAFTTTPVAADNTVRSFQGDLNARGTRNSFDISRGAANRTRFFSPPSFQPQNLAVPPWSPYPGAMLNLPPLSTNPNLLLRSAPQIPMPSTIINNPVKTGQQQWPPRTIVQTYGNRRGGGFGRGGETRQQSAEQRDRRDILGANGNGQFSRGNTTNQTGFWGNQKDRQQRDTRRFAGGAFQGRRDRGRQHMRTVTK